jgi:hypothetical protein
MDTNQVLFYNICRRLGGLLFTNRRLPKAAPSRLGVVGAFQKTSTFFQVSGLGLWSLK